MERKSREDRSFRITPDTHSIMPNPQLRGEVIFTPQEHYLQRRSMRRITQSNKR